MALLLESAQVWRASRNEDAAQARTLATCLGCLPLALTHATAYMQHHHKGFAAYLDDFEKHFEKLLAYHDDLAIEYETEVEEKSGQPATPEARAARKKFVKTVATTFFLSFDRLAAEAKAILQSAAFLAPDPIPMAMYDQCPEEVAALVTLWCEETSTAKTGQTVADALAELARYSLITRDEGVFSLRRMEQLVLRSRVRRSGQSNTERMAWATAPADPSGAHKPGHFAGDETGSAARGCPEKPPGVRPQDLCGHH